MTEFWLSGPFDGVPPLLTPAAHTFLQVRQDVPALLADLSVDQLWRRAGASASFGFHAVHIAGATDRLMTQARGVPLTEARVAAARDERTMAALDAAELARRVVQAMDDALDELRRLPESTLFEPRAIGRKQLPATAFGVLAHAAEHAYRHAGQIATLKKIIA